MYFFFDFVTTLYLYLFLQVNLTGGLFHINWTHKAVNNVTIGRMGEDEEMIKLPLNSTLTNELDLSFFTLQCKQQGKRI